jgi:hypothetical protein
MLKEVPNSENSIPTPAPKDPDFTRDDFNKRRAERSKELKDALSKLPDTYKANRFYWSDGGYTQVEADGTVTEVGPKTIFTYIYDYKGTILFVAAASGLAIYYFYYPEETKNAVTTIIATVTSWFTARSDNDSSNNSTETKASNETAKANDNVKSRTKLTHGETVHSSPEKGIYTTDSKGNERTLFKHHSLNNSNPSSFDKGKGLDVITSPVMEPVKLYPATPEYGSPSTSGSSSPLLSKSPSSSMLESSTMGSSTPSSSGSSTPTMPGSLTHSSTNLKDSTFTPSTSGSSTPTNLKDSTKPSLGSSIPTHTQAAASLVDLSTGEPLSPVSPASPIMPGHYSSIFVKNAYDFIQALPPEIDIPLECSDDTYDLEKFKDILKEMTEQINSCIHTLQGTLATGSREDVQLAVKYIKYLGGENLRIAQIRVKLDEIRV